jgi:hypothetical protein
MSLIRKGAVFVVRELAKAVTTDAGREIGLAVGQRLGRWLDPAGVKHRYADDGDDSNVDKSKEQK